MLICDGAAPQQMDARVRASDSTHRGYLCSQAYAPHGACDRRYDCARYLGTLPTIASSTSRNALDNSENLSSPAHLLASDMRRRLKPHPE